MTFCSRLFKWKDMTQQKRISILHYKNGSKITASDARNETAESLDHIQDILLNDSRSSYVMLRISTTMNITKFFQVTVELKALISSYWMYLDDPSLKGPPKVFLERKPEAYFSTQYATQYVSDKRC